MKILPFRFVLLLGALPALALPVAAQFNVRGLVDSVTKGPSPDVTAFQKAVQGATANVATARVAFLEAQSLLIQSVDPKNASALKLSEARRAVEGASSDQKKHFTALKDSQKVSEEANAVLTKKLGESQKLSEESRALYIKGAVKYIEAVVLEKKQVDIVLALADRAKTVGAAASAADKVQAGSAFASAAQLSLMVPGDLKIAGETLPKLFSFAKKEGIEVPMEDEQKKIIGLLD